jgi:hypothetical protein
MVFLARCRVKLFTLSTTSGYAAFNLPCLAPKILMHACRCFRLPSITCTSRWFFCHQSAPTSVALSLLATPSSSAWPDSKTPARYSKQLIIAGVLRNFLRQSSVVEFQTRWLWMWRRSCQWVRKDLPNLFSAVSEPRAVLHACWVLSRANADCSQKVYICPIFVNDKIKACY